MTRTLSDLTESVGDVVSTGVSVVGDLASSAAHRTGDLAAAAIEQVSDAPERLGDLARERFAPAPKKSRSPWLVLIFVAAVAAGAVWWWRRNGSAQPEPVRSTPPTTPAVDGQSTASATP